MKVAVLQSSYLPWKGYFDLIHDSDLFIFYDDIQFTKNDWRNRNKIKTSKGLMWLSVPVGSKIHRNIDQVEIQEHSWQRKHYSSIKQNYTKATYFKIYKDWLEYLYLEREWISLSELNQFIMKTIARDFLHLKTQFRNSTEFNLEGQKGDRLLDLLTKVKCKEYFCGPSSRHYLEVDRFSSLGIKVNFKDTIYPPYKQLYKPYENFISIIDTLLCTGPEAPYYIWGWRS